MPDWHRNRIRLFLSKIKRFFASIVYPDNASIMFTVIAHSKAAEDPHGARQLGVASIVLSVIGLIIGIILLIITIIMVVVMGALTASAMEEASDFHCLHSNRPPHNNIAYFLSGPPCIPDGYSLQNSTMLCNLTLLSES